MNNIITYEQFVASFAENQTLLMINKIVDEIIDGFFDKNREFAWNFGKLLDSSGATRKNSILKCLNERIKYGSYSTEEELDYEEMLKINRIAEMKKFIDGFKDKGMISVRISADCISSPTHDFRNDCSLEIDNGKVLNPEELFKLLEILKKQNINYEIPRFHDEAYYVFGLQNNIWREYSDISTNLYGCCLFILCQPMGKI